MAPKPGGLRREDTDDAIDPSADTTTKLLKFLRERLDPADYDRVDALLSNSSEGDLVGDRALRATDPTSRAVQRMQDIAMAEREVKPYAGDILGLDSAASVYTTALSRMGHDVALLHPSAAKTMFRTLRHSGNKPRAYAMDSVAEKSLAEKFPGVAKLKLR